ncbi:hypothetical protein [Sphingomonas aracearum]|uniref:DUF2029 domain-containing protein n=1 Tax=Sphingomonas aracearum TaxID=2283317 RepID=A0A369VWR9_9SPHN|nr:hypothetical protein [Sphingomonas aracearum]RDE06836.1 hypothetical protein DVW87_03925 [Sphingomonas aracearum]
MAGARLTRRLPPLWLAEGSRFAGLSRPRARLVLALLALLLAACLTALASPGPPPVSHDPAQRGNDQADVVLYEGIVSGVRHGGEYYDVAAHALRAGNYPLRPFVTFRLPTLAVVQAHLPPFAVPLLLYALAAGVVAAWYGRLRPAFVRPPPLAVALVLLIAGMAAFVQAELATFHEVWAGLLIALGLAVRREDRWTEAVALGLVAMLIRETAALYVAIMLGLALLEGRGREAGGWAGALAVFAVVVVLHARAVEQVVRPLDPASPGWAGMLGFGFFVKTMTLSTALALAPALLAALLVGFALFGWFCWASGTALRVLATLAGYALLLSLFGRTDTFYWGLMVAPTLLLGLAFLPDGLRDLVAAARDGRRITVTRVQP